MVQVQSYEVIRPLAEGMEVRLYPAHDVVCVEVRGDLETAGYSGFGYLASYISGNNENGQRIAMTSPVLQHSSSSSETVCFVIPDSVAQAGSPTPSSPAVRVERRTGGHVAAIRFRGSWKTETIHAATAKLREVLQREGIVVTGEPFYARYNPPSVPGIFRRNEVLIPVASA